MPAILSSCRRLGAMACVALAATLVAGSAAPAVGDPHPRALLRANTAQVKIREFAFHPGTLRISPGTRVVFANRDRTAHTATKRGSFDTGRIRSGQTAAVRFGSRGTFPYHCKIHSFMRGKIVVQ